MILQITNPTECLYLFIIGLSLVIIFLLFPKVKRELKTELKKYIDDQINKKFKI